jgi:excisionase family DNA binding protein
MNGNEYMGATAAPAEAPCCHGCGNQLAEFAGPGDNHGLVCLTPGCDLQDIDMEAGVPLPAFEETPESQGPISRMPIREIARHLAIGRLAVYALLEQGIIPGIRIGSRWIITRQGYARWCAQSCGTAALGNPK